MIRVHMRITGRVQGVGFRWATQDQAMQLRLTGWVRNTEDRAVEVVAEGNEEAIERFVAWCHTGPPGARVDQVREQRWEASGEFRAFRITG